MDWHCKCIGMGYDSWRRSEANHGPILMGLVIKTQEKLRIDLGFIFNTKKLYVSPHFSAHRFSVYSVPQMS